MAAKLDDSVFDAALSKIATSTTLTLTSGEPANLAGVAAVALGAYTVDSGDFTVANGDTSGRKVTIGAQTGNNASGTGTVTHACLDDGTTLLAVTTVASQAVVSGSPVDIGAFKFEMTDPTVS